MKLHRSLSLVLGALAVAATGMLGYAKIERLSLDDMVGRADDAVYGTITHRLVFREDDPVDGPELYFTTLTIEGRSLVTGKPLTTDVTFWGGFVNEEEGVFNSEAPPEDFQKIGTKVVAFYKWNPNMGAQVSANALYASHGGLYRTIQTRRGTVVLGQGDGYAIPHNVNLDSLDLTITETRKRIDEERKQEKR